MHRPCRHISQLVDGRHDPAPERGPVQIPGIETLVSFHGGIYRGLVTMPIGQGKSAMLYGGIVGHAAAYPQGGTGCNSRGFSRPKKDRTYRPDLATAAART